MFSMMFRVIGFVMGTVLATLIAIATVTIVTALVLGCQTPGGAP